MRFLAVTLLVGWVCLLSKDCALGQNSKTDPSPPALTARIEVDGHEHSFTVRFFLKNNGENDAEVVYGRGGSGLQVVPRFDVAGVMINPPTYFTPPRRSMEQDVRRIPAGKEILYGTFTMGYPPVERKRDKEEKVSAVINFRELKATIQAEPQLLKIPAQKEPK